jgi:hypothetical protein
VFIFVAVNAEVLPVGAISRVIPAIAVFVVHRQEVPVLIGKFPAALGADEAVNLQGAFPVITAWRFHFGGIPFNELMQKRSRALS